MTKKSRARAAVNSDPSIKKRGLLVIQCLANGLTLKEVAVALGEDKTESMVKRDCLRLREYFGAGTNVEMVLMARREWNLDL